MTGDEKPRFWWGAKKRREWEAARDARRQRMVAEYAPAPPMRHRPSAGIARSSDYMSAPVYVIDTPSFESRSACSGGYSSSYSSDGGSSSSSSDSGGGSSCD